MTGANYTGGKRNVARTRFRDSTRRVQKNHFGRRRLGILSRGLVNGTHPTEEQTTSGISGILLEHAQREISRPSRSSPVQRTGVRHADPSSSTGSSTSGSNVTRPQLRFTRTLDYGNYSSLRAEVNRILEFSRTIGLCNYSTSPRQDAPASLASRVDSEPGQYNLLQRHDNPSSSMGGSSCSRQHAKTFIGHTVQDSEILEMSQSGTSGSNSLREATPHEGDTDLVYAEPMSNFEYPGHCNSDSESPFRSTCILDSPPGEDIGLPRMLEINFYPTNRPSLPFDALGFSTSPLPPSSPLPSSTIHGSLLSDRQVSHRAEAETTLLNFDEIPLPSTMSGSCGAGSFSRYGDSCRVTPDSDLSSASPLRHLPRSGLAHIVPGHLDPYSTSKADLIPDLLTCDDPWNAIGDMLDLPPIPTADAVYFTSIRLHHTGLSLERVSSPASSSSLGQVGIGDTSCATRDEGTQSRAVHSDEICPDPWSVENSLKTSRRAASLLSSRDSPKEVRSPARSFRSIHETCPSRSAQSPSPSLSATSGNSPVVTEAPQSLLKPQAPPVSPGPLRGTSGKDLEESYSSLVKTLPPSHWPQIPSPKNLDSLKEFLSPSPATLLSQWNETTESISVELVLQVFPTETTATKAQHPKLEFPDIFKDEEDSFGAVF